jgi:RNA polymerase sigma-70 factor, ECF subfamily
LRLSPFPELSDIIIVNQSQGDINREFLSRYGLVHERFSRYCRSHAWGLLDPEDLVQETVLIALQRYDSIKDKEKLLYWMICVANNLVRDLMRRQKFSATYDEKMLHRMESRTGNPETAMDMHYLHKAINQLGAQEKEALLMFEVSGFTMQEIADVQQCRVEAVKTRVSRARQRVRKLLHDEGVPELRQEHSFRLTSLL